MVRVGARAVGQQRADDQGHGAPLVLVYLCVGARQYARSQIEADAGMHAHAERQAIGTGATRRGPVRVVLGRIVAEDRLVAVGRHQVHADHVFGRGIFAGGKVYRTGGPAARGGAGGMQAHALVDGFLQKQRVFGIPLRVFGMARAPVENFVCGMGQRMHGGEGAGQQEKPDLLHQYIGRDGGLGFAAQQVHQHIARQGVLADFTAMKLLQNKAAPGHGGLEEVPVELRQRGPNLGADRFAVPQCLAQRGGFAEGAQYVQQPGRFLRRAGRPIHTREVGGQVHHDPKAEVHQVGLAGGEVGGQGLPQRGRENLGLVPLEEVAPEYLGLDQAAVAMFIAMQIDQHLLHENGALVVQSLPQVRQPQGVAGLFVAGNNDGGHGFLR